MSNLQSLLLEKCPNGVAYQPLGDVCDTVTDYVAAGSFAELAKRVQYLSQPDYALLVRTMDIKSNFTKGNLIYIDESAYEFLWRVHLDQDSIVLPNIGNCGEVYYLRPSDLPFERCALATNAILVRASQYNLRYLFYVFQTPDFQKKLAKIISPTGQTKFNKTDLKKITIPVPPIEIQDEIVQILDNFAELTAELTAELSNRKKQYEYYRNLLLRFDENTERERVGLIMRYEQPGKYIVKSTAYSDEYKTPVLTAGQSFILGYTNETENIFHASKENPVIIFDDFTTSFHWVDFDFKVKSSAMKMLRLNNREKASLRYVYYAMQCINYTPGEHSRQWISKYSNFEIPLPRKETQDKIVDTLNKFDSIASSLSEGIPAEIEARQKQYAYYRDKLLTFEEAK